LARHGKFFAGYQGLCLYQQFWLPDGTARAIVAIQHGLSEHSGRYAALAQVLNQHGYAVCAMDLRGHGRSTGARVWIRRFEQYLDDLEVFLASVQSAGQGKPLFLFGHSMGAIISARYCITRQPELQGLILSGPAVLVGGSVYPILRRIATVASYIVPWLRTVRLGCRFASRDPAVVAAFENDPLSFHGRLPVRTAAELFRAARLLRAEADKLHQPLLILHGTADVVADYRGSHMLYQSAGSADKTLKLYDGLYHEVLSEPEKQIVLADLLAWLDARAK
jgi:acylglycerol lipase